MRLKNLKDARSWAPLRMTKGDWGELAKYLFWGDGDSARWRPGAIFSPDRADHDPMKGKKPDCLTQNGPQMGASPMPGRESRLCRADMTGRQKN